MKLLDFGFAKALDGPGAFDGAALRAPDGRFLINTTIDIDGHTAPITLLQNWAARYVWWVR